MTTQPTTEMLPPMTLDEALARHNAAHPHSRLTDVTDKLHTEGVCDALAACKQARKHRDEAQAFVDAPTTNTWYKSRLRAHVADAHAKADAAERVLFAALHLALHDVATGG